MTKLVIRYGEWLESKDTWPYWVRIVLVSPFAVYMFYRSWRYGDPL